MKKTPIIIVIPALVVALVVGAAMVWRFKTQTASSVAASPPAQLPRSFEQAGEGKPTNPFGSFFGFQVTPTSTSETVDSMNADLQTIGDDGGAAEFSSLQQDISGL